MAAGIVVLAAGPDAEASWLLSRAYLQEGARDEARAAGSFSDENPTLADPAPFVGSASCAECHADKFRVQRGSRHARTFYQARELGDLALPGPSFPDPANARVAHVLRKSGNRLELETRTEDQIYRAVVAYAFGSGDRGKTLVGRDASGKPRELRLSVYHEGARSVWDVTSGHPQHPTKADEYLGQPLSEDAVGRCLSCHVTNPRAVLEASGPEAADHSIGCEKCHGPGGNHLLAVAAEFPDLAIVRPGLASGSRVVAICAQCHSPRGIPVLPDDPTSVRFQSTTLTWSRCYTESNDMLDCTTCHDPHRDASTSPKFYEAKCLSCHGGGRPAGAGSGGERTKGRLDLVETPRTTVCPVNPAEGCVSCHMPTVRTVIPHTPFTDHFIRVHRDSASGSGASPSGSE